jgi:hypothetical protein
MTFSAIREGRIENNQIEEGDRYRNVLVKEKYIRK